VAPARMTARRNWGSRSADLHVANFRLRIRSGSRCMNNLIGLPRPFIGVCRKGNGFASDDEKERGILNSTCRMQNAEQAILIIDRRSGRGAVAPLSVRNGVTYGLPARCSKGDATTVSTPNLASVMGTYRHTGLPTDQPTPLHCRTTVLHGHPLPSLASLPDRSGGPFRKLFYT
jgi:hypothetical protein